MALYDQVVDLARVYLGPAGKKFIDRQIRAHLEMDGSQLAPGDIEELATWCYTSSKILMNEGKAREFGERVKSLGNGSSSA